MCSWYRNSSRGAFSSPAGRISDVWELVARRWHPLQENPKAFARVFAPPSCQKIYSFAATHPNPKVPPKKKQKNKKLPNIFCFFGENPQKNQMPFEINFSEETWPNWPFFSSKQASSMQHAKTHSIGSSCGQLWRYPARRPEGNTLLSREFVLDGLRPLPTSQP